MIRGMSTSTDDQRFQAYVRALLQSGDERAVFEALDTLIVPRPYYVRMKVLYSERSPVDVFDELATGDNLQPFATETASYHYKCTIGRKHQVEVDIPFIVLSFSEMGLPNRVQAVVSICRSHEWGALTRFLRSAYPRLVPILLSQRELISSVKGLRASTGHSVQVRSYSAKERIDLPMTRQWKVKRAWTDEDLDQVLLTVQDRHEVITSLDVVFFPRVGELSHVVPNAVCKIRKTGEIEIDGSFRLAFEAMGAEVARVGYKKLSFYSGRGLRHSEYKPKPLEITYTQPIFEETEVVRAFVRVLAQYPHSMHAVQHGNPYAHVKLTDVSDFSSFDLWAVPPSRLALLPGLRASAAAFERLVDYVFEHFKEGEVADYLYDG